MMVVVLGYMGSGKSSISKFLGEKLCLPVIDLDVYIEMKEESSIHEIFASKGEIYFRKKEHLYLKEVLETQADCILSLGGGTPCYANNMQLIHSYTKDTFYLKTSIPEIVKRVKDEKNKRPLIKDINLENLSEFVGKHLFERVAFYEEASFIVTTDTKTISMIAFEIIDQLN